MEPILFMNILESTHAISHMRTLLLSISSKALAVFALLGSSVAGGRAGGHGLRPAAAAAVAVVERRRRRPPGYFSHQIKKKSRQQIRSDSTRWHFFAICMTPAPISTRYVVNKMSQSQKLSQDILTSRARLTG